MAIAVILLWCCVELLRDRSWACFGRTGVAFQDNVIGLLADFGGREDSIPNRIRHVQTNLGQFVLAHLELCS